MDDPISAAVDAARKSRNDGRLDEAYQDYWQAVSLARAAHNAQVLAGALRHVSDVGREIGNLQAALTAGQEAIAILRTDVNSAPLDLANALRVTALALQELGRKDEARPIWREARALYAEVGVEEGVAECEINL